MEGRGTLVVSAKSCGINTLNIASRMQSCEEMHTVSSWKLVWSHSSTWLVDDLRNTAVGIVWGNHETWQNKSGTQGYKTIMVHQELWESINPNQCGGRSDIDLWLLDIVHIGPRKLKADSTQVGPLAQPDIVAKTYSVMSPKHLCRNFVTSSHLIL